jgi:hypothetical protein
MGYSSNYLLTGAKSLRLFVMAPSSGFVDDVDGLAGFIVGAADGLACLDRAADRLARFVFAADSLVDIDGAADESACFLGAADGKLATPR